MTPPETSRFTPAALPHDLLAGLLAGAASDPADDLPATPPAEVLAAVDTAHERMKAFAADGIDVGFGADPRTGRLTATLRSGDAARALDLFDVIDLVD